MTAEAKMNRSETGDALTLAMGRRTARVVVKVAGFRDEFDGGSPEVTGVSVRSRLTVPEDDDSSPFTPIQTFKKDNSFYSLVCPGAASPDGVFMELTVEYGDPRRSVTQTVTGVPAMEAGKSYTYSVTVGKTTAKVGSVSVIDWTGGAAIDDGVTEAAPEWSGNAEPFAERDASGAVLGGSESSPILIESAEQLAYLAQQVNNGNAYKGKYLKLADNIDIINLANKPWTPIGNRNAGFCGHFDGNGKRIYGLNVSSNGYAGLFGRASVGSIRNVRIESARIVCGTSNYAAVLCGYARDMAIDNCSVRGTVESSWTYVGGLVGLYQSVTMTNCTAEVSVKGTDLVGGLCGYMDSGSISDCTVVNSRVEGTDDDLGCVGGLVGRIQLSTQNATVEECSVAGCVIKGVKYVGGLVGNTHNNNSSRVSISISGCTASADLTVTGESCGGIVGSISGQYEAKFSGCGFDGTITNENKNKVGAAVGGDDSVSSSFTDCWYNADKTGGLKAVGSTIADKDYSGIKAKTLGK